MSESQRIREAADLLVRQGYRHIDKGNAYPLGVWQHDQDGRRVILQSDGHILSGEDLRQWVARTFPELQLRVSSYARNWG